MNAAQKVVVVTASVATAVVLCVVGVTFYKDSSNYYPLADLLQLLILAGIVLAGAILAVSAKRWQKVVMVSAAVAIADVLFFTGLKSDNATMKLLLLVLAVVVPAGALLAIFVKRKQPEPPDPSVEPPRLGGARGPAATSPTAGEPHIYRPVGSESGANGLIWTRPGRWIAYPLLIIATLAGSYFTGRYLFAKAGFSRGFGAGYASMSLLGKLLAKDLVADSIRDNARNSVFAQAGLLDYLRLAAYPRNKISTGEPFAVQWLVARFDMVPANELVSDALGAASSTRGSDIGSLLGVRGPELSDTRLFRRYVAEIDKLSSDEWPTLAADLDLDTVPVPRFEAMSPVIQFRWLYVGADRVHYVVEP